MIHLYNADCLSVLPSLPEGNYCIVTDPPFNQGYHYNSYKDNLPEEEYYKWLVSVLTALGNKIVCVHYPDALHKLSVAMNAAPNRVVSWCYNSNTAKQHRDIAFYGITPDFRKATQPYKNPNDKRIKRLIESGKSGGRLYDWWQINQVKNVSKKDISHPCVMPVQVMENIIKIIPSELVVVDPFMGSGTTGIACKRLGREFVGIEIDPEYFEIAKRRIEEAIT